MKELIRHILKEETNRKTMIRKMIKDLGIGNTTIIMGGVGIFMKKMDINDPMGFLHLFDDLNVVQSTENPDYILFRYEPKKNLMVYDKKNKTVYINYYEIWSVLQDFFGLNFTETQQLTMTWLDEVYNLRGITTTLGSTRTYF